MLQGMKTSLTPEDMKTLEVVREKWLAAGLSTEPADRPRAEAGIRQAYRAANLPEPKIILWCDSPWAAVVCWANLPAVIKDLEDAGVIPPGLIDR